MPRTFLATLQFDGTDFVGWQRQREGRTVQQEFEAVLARLAGHAVPVYAAGRTDSGVHALGMGVSFSLPDRWTPSALLRALNALLPRDCFVVGVAEALDGFHARRSATARQYRYLIGTDRLARSPFRRPFEWALGEVVDEARLSAAATRVIGSHDFKAFAVARPDRPHTRCEIGTARWERRPCDQGFSFEIGADRFLHHMVRMLVGTMVDIARDHRPMEDLDRLLAREPGVVTSPPAPPQGLYFVTASYPDRWFPSARCLD
jgi:tRNA pseudouridine38-40 synthase